MAFLHATLPDLPSTGRLPTHGGNRACLISTPPRIHRNPNQKVRVLSNHNPLPGPLPGLGAPNGHGPEIVNAVEIHMAQITGMAIGDNAEMIGLRGLDVMGGTVVFTFPTAIGEICADQLRRAAEGARQIQTQANGEIPAAPMMTVEQPQAFQVAYQDQMVLVAFDPGAPSARLIGLPAAAAMNLARALAEAATKVFAKQPKPLILPNGLIRN